MSLISFVQMDGDTLNLNDDDYLSDSRFDGFAILDSTFTHDFSIERLLMSLYKCVVSFVSNGFL